MDLLEKIKQSKDGKPKTWQRIAEYVCEHPKEVAYMKLGELRQALSVSDGSIINFVRSLGCGGYSEFRVRLSQSDHGFSKKNFVSSAADITERITEELQELAASLDTDALETLSERIANSDRVYLLGLETSAHVAQILSGYLVRLGILSSVLTENQTRVCSLLHKEDTVLAISYSGSTDTVNRAVRNAKAAGAAVACITSFMESELASICDIALCINTAEARNGNFPLISRVCQLTVAEMLLSRIAEKMKVGGE